MLSLHVVAVPHDITEENTIQSYNVVKVLEEMEGQGISDIRGALAAIWKACSAVSLERASMALESSSRALSSSCRRRLACSWRSRRALFLRRRGALAEEGIVSTSFWYGGKEYYYCLAALEDYDTLLLFLTPAEFVASGTVRMVP